MSYVRVSDTGKLIGTIFISLDHESNVNLIEGVGIPKEYLDQVFERFFRVNNNASLLIMVA